MKSKAKIRHVIYNYQENKLIFASDLYKEHLSNEMSEIVYYKTLERMCNTQELVKISKGIYCKPKKSKYGTILPNENDIVDLYVGNTNGMIVGYKMYNLLGLTTQVSKKIEVYSSMVNNQNKNIQNVFIKQIKLNYTEELVKMIQFLEVLQNFNKIQDLNYSAFLNYSKKQQVYRLNKK